jgi:RimJ/RimL family protein N-acetyltransferase
MRHLMPIVTPRLILRPPDLGDLDSIQDAKEEAWPDLQRWMAWAFDDQRSREAMEKSIRRVMDYQDQAGIALAAFHRINGDFVIRTALELTDEAESMKPDFGRRLNTADRAWRRRRQTPQFVTPLATLVRKRSVLGTSTETNPAAAS